MIHLIAKFVLQALDLSMGFELSNNEFPLFLLTHNLHTVYITKKFPNRVTTLDELALSSYVEALTHTISNTHEETKAEIRIELFQFITPLKMSKCTQG